MSRSVFFNIHEDWRPRLFPVRYTKEELTPAAGLDPLVNLFVESPQWKKLRDCLPERRSNASYDTGHIALTVIAAFLRGYDSLEDIDKFADDPFVLEKFGSIPSSRAVGDYLRDFSAENLEQLNSFLHTQAMAGRRQLGQPKSLTIDLDSTSHVQSGDKIEGVAYNYKDEWCLDSLVAYDEMGLVHGFDLRPGNTFSAQDAGKMIDGVFRDVEGEKFFRGDSAFCNEEVFRACLSRQVRFTITAHGNTNWEGKASTITNWTPWRHSEERQERAQAKKKDLPIIEVGSFVYQPAWSEGVRFFCIVKRTWVKKADLFGEGHWKYYAIFTNRSAIQNSMQEIMEFHHKRGNAENMIREEKHGYDLKHFPCLKLVANKAYGMLGLIAHNFFRTLAHIDDPQKPKFSKKLRATYVNIPGKLVRHARELTLKIPERYREEVERMRSAWRYSPSPSLNTG